MSSPGRIFCLVAFLCAFCLLTEARVKFPGVSGAFVPRQKRSESASSESTSSETDDAAVAAAAAAPPAPAPAPVGGNQVGGNLPILSANGRQLPNTGARDRNQMFGREAGSSGKSVGIAFAVLALIAVVVVGAYFAARKYRPHIAAFEEED